MDDEMELNTRRLEQMIATSGLRYSYEARHGLIIITVPSKGVSFVFDRKDCLISIDNAHIEASDKLYRIKNILGG